MRFGWINWINLAVVACLILINIIVAKKDHSDSFTSKYLTVNILEQIGRYGCIALMIFPIGVRNWKFGFGSVMEMLLWVYLTILFLGIYIFLWLKKAKGGVSILYGLTIVPIVLFLLNGVLLRHLALVIVALVFGAFHFVIVKENV